MSDYAVDVSANDYIYIQEISITETGGEDRTDFTVKLSFNSTNFNFEFARSDGKDLRIGERSNGSMIFNMWIATWSVTNNIGVIWLKIPLLEANKIKTLYVYFGHPVDSGISDIDTVDFIFADGFDGTSVDTTKWNYSDVQDVSNSKIRIKTDGYIEAKGTPLSGLTKWIVEEGIYLNAALTATDKAYYRHRFYGTENNFGFNYYGEGSVDRKHNAVNGSTYVTYNGTEKGLEGQSYSENFIVYKESEDKVYQSMAKRDTYVDYIDSWERQVYGDTRATYFRIYGRDDDTAPWVYIDWVIVREYFETEPYTFDTSNLRPLWELIEHQIIDWTEYDSDVTSINYYHSTSSGGDPYRLSDNLYGSLSDCWVSDDDAGTGSVDLIIDFGRGAEDDNLVSWKYNHYDSGHVLYHGAAKLSDNDEDINTNSYFQSTTVSGYVCIDFDIDRPNVGCLAIRGLTGSLGAMVKNFIFSGTDVDPRFAEAADLHTIYSGEFVKTDAWQTIYFEKDRAFTYFKLEILSTHEGDNAIIREWQMYDYDALKRKMIISQLRLLPVAFSSQEYYFPKQISISVSNDMVNWSPIMFTTDTYTPAYDYTWGRWQRYSFTNTGRYYCYKVICNGNWNSNVGKMAIAEWEMAEKNSEAYTYRILAGDSNDFKSIWAGSTTSFDGGFFYTTAEDVLSTVYNDELSDYTTVSGIVSDINVI